jgi:hypothetical protein
MVFVYIVTEKVFDDYKIRGIYSTKEKALAVVKNRKKESKYSEIWYDVYALDSDEEY